MYQLGHTRSAHKSDHLLHTPDTFVRAPLPGMRRATAIVHVGAAAGALFTQYTAEFEAGGELETTPLQRLRWLEQAKRFAALAKAAADRRRLQR